MKYKILAIVATAMFAAPAVSQAAPITLSAGDSILWNFDLTGEDPSPPYERVVVRTNSSGSSMAVGLWEFFGDLHGVGLISSSTSLNATGYGFRSSSPNSGPILDGIFSARLTLTEGWMTLDPCAQGSDNIIAGQPTNLTTCVSGTVVSSVPEPTTLALLGLGLVGIGLRRRIRAS